jgi:hypothetical protein
MSHRITHTFVYGSTTHCQTMGSQFITVFVTNSHNCCHWHDVKFNVFPQDFFKLRNQPSSDLFSARKVLIRCKLRLGGLKSSLIFKQPLLSTSFHRVSTLKWTIDARNTLKPFLPFGKMNFEPRI